MLYFCTINHGNIPFFSKDGISSLDINYGDSNSPELLYKAARKKSIPTGEKTPGVPKKWETFPLYFGQESKYYF